MSAKMAELRAALHEAMASVRRMNDALDALIDAVPPGLTQDELRDVGRRFAALAEQAGPRRGLCRFGPSPGEGDA